MLNPVTIYNKCSNKILDDKLLPREEIHLYIDSNTIKGSHPRKCINSGNRKRCHI